VTRFWSTFLHPISDGSRDHDALAEFLAISRPVRKLNVLIPAIATALRFSGIANGSVKPWSTTQNACDRIVSALMAGAKSAHELVGELETGRCLPFITVAIFEVWRFGVSEAPAPRAGRRQRMEFVCGCRAALGDSLS